MKKRDIFLAVFAAVLVLAGSAGSAWAYFTTYVEARGMLTLEMGDETTIDEPKFESWTKHIVVSSDKGSKPVYVRARAFCGSEYKLVYTGSSKWTPGSDGYYYYSDILNGGEKTEELLVKIENVPVEDVKDGSEFNVVVIYETTPVLYDESGKPYADWNAKQEARAVEGGNS